MKKRLKFLFPSNHKFYPSRWPECWRQAGVVYLTVRLISWLIAILSFSSFPSDSTDGQAGYIPPIYSKLTELFFGIWERSDAVWYIGISQGGYAKDPRAFVFMPFYPFLIRIATKLLPFPEIVCALFVSNLCFFLGLGFLYQLVKNEYDSKTAERTLWYLALFPGSLFMLAPYSESTFFLLSVLAFFMARQGRFWQAGIFGALLGVTRNLGSGIVMPLIIEAFCYGRSSKSSSKSSGKSSGFDRATFYRILGVLFAPLGLLAWIAFLYWDTGDPLAFIHHQNNWQRQAQLPWETVYEGLIQAWKFIMTYPGGIYVFDAISVLGALVLAGAALVMLAPSLSAFTWMCLLPPLLNPYPGRMFMSCIRFISVIFPLFIVLALMIRKESTDQKIRLMFASTYAIAIALYICNHYMF